MAIPQQSNAVLIVGAGPAGLVLALTLRKHGVPVRIIDKAPGPYRTQRGAGIMARSQELYTVLGVWQDMVEAGAQAAPLMRAYEFSGGQHIAEFSLDPERGSTPAAPFITPRTLGQHQAERILRTHLAEYGTEVEFGTELQKFIQYPSHVEAHILEKTGNEKVSEVNVPWLVGTDGARGITRKELGLTFLGESRDSTQHLLVGDVVVAGLDPSYWHKWGDIGRALVMLRPTEETGTFHLISGGAIDRAKCLESNEELLRTLKWATGKDDIDLREVRSLAEYKPNIRMVNKFGEGRVFVGGDAAHVHSVFGGQGMNTSVQDSFNLAWKLALVYKDLASPTLLHTYTEERLPVIAEMLDQTTRLLNKTVVSRTGTKEDQAAWDRGGRLNQLGVNYRWSSIVVDERQPFSAGVTWQPLDAYGGGDGRVRAGERAPDAPGLLIVKARASTDGAAEGSSTSLFRIFDPAKHTVLLFAAHAERVAPFIEALKPYPKDVLQNALVFPAGSPASAKEAGKADIGLVDQDGHAYEGYTVEKGVPTVVIVRPDVVVGGIMTGIEALQHYLDGIFLPVLTATNIGGRRGARL